MMYAMKQNFTSLQKVATQVDFNRIYCKQSNNFGQLIVKNVIGILNLNPNFFSNHIRFEPEL